MDWTWFSATPTDISKLPSSAVRSFSLITVQLARATAHMAAYLSLMSVALIPKWQFLMTSVLAALFGLLAGFSNGYLWAKTETCYIKAAPTYVNMYHLALYKLDKWDGGRVFNLNSHVTAPGPPGCTTPTSPPASGSDPAEIWPSALLRAAALGWRPSGFGGLIVFNHTPDRGMYIYIYFFLHIIYIYIYYI